MSSIPDNTDNTDVGHIRWTRFAVIMLPAAVVAGAMVFATAEGALAASFAVSGSVFKVTTAELRGEGFGQFVAVDHSKDGTSHPVLVSTFRHATIRGLCQSAKVGPFTVTLRAGNGSRPVSADDLVLDVASLRANATFTNVEIGRDASTLTHGPTGAPGTFGQQADALRLTDVQETAWATTAGTFTLPGLTLNFGSGCF